MVILLYHDIVRPYSSRYMYTVESDLFAQQIVWLMDNGYQVLSMRSLARMLLASEALPQKSAALTFDDGLSGHFGYAYPILKKFRIPGCFFIIADRIGTRGYMGWDQIKALAADGMEIGSHGIGHQVFELMPRADIVTLLKRSKEILEKGLSAEVAFFSIPRGSVSRSHEKMVMDMVREAGYAVACSSRVGYVDSSSSSLFLPRFPLRSGDTLRDFRQIAEKKSSKFVSCKAREISLDFLKQCLGLRNYERLRRACLREEYRNERAPGE